jgi:hypothetical protein
VTTYSSTGTAPTTNVKDNYYTSNTVLSHTNAKGVNGKPFDLFMLYMLGEWENFWKKTVGFDKDIWSFDGFLPQLSAFASEDTGSDTNIGSPADPGSSPNPDSNPDPGDSADPGYNPDPTPVSGSGGGCDSAGIGGFGLWIAVTASILLYSKQGKTAKGKDENNAL